MYRNLKIYTFKRFEKELGGTKVDSKEICEKLKKELEASIDELGGKPKDLTALIETFTAAHEKDIEFRVKVHRNLQQELLYKHVNFANRINELEDTVASTEKSGNRKLDILQTSLNKKLAEAGLGEEALQKKLETKETFIKSQSDRIDELVSTNEDSKKDNRVEYQLKTSLEEYSKLQIEIQTAQKAYDKLFVQKTELQEQVTEAEANVLQLSQELAHEKNATSTLENRVENLIKTLEIETKESYNKNLRIIKFRESSDKFEAELQTQTAELDELKAEFEDVNRRLKADCETLEENINDLSNEAIQKDNELLQKDNEIIAKEKEILDLQNKLATALQQVTANPAVTQIVPAAKMAKNDPMTKHLAELYSREEKKTIPLFLGTGDERLVADWIREAERVADSNDWSSEQRVKYFSDRLKDDAVDWHISHLETHARDDYVSWKTALLEILSYAADVENLRRK